MVRANCAELRMFLVPRAEYLALARKLIIPFLADNGLPVG
jgi:hypothetical protein